jgi:hypothetical protein
MTQLDLLAMRLSGRERRVIVSAGLAILVVFLGVRVIPSGVAHIRTLRTSRDSLQHVVSRMERSIASARETQARLTRLGARGTAWRVPAHASSDLAGAATLGRVQSLTAALGIELASVQAINDPLGTRTERAGRRSGGIRRVAVRAAVHTDLAGLLDLLAAVDSASDPLALRSISVSHSGVAAADDLSIDFVL